MCERGGFGTRLGPPPGRHSPQGDGAFLRVHGVAGLPPCGTPPPRVRTQEADTSCPTTAQTRGFYYKKIKKNKHPKSRRIRLGTGGINHPESQSLPLPPRNAPAAVRFRVVPSPSWGGETHRPRPPSPSQNPHGGGRRPRGVLGTESGDSVPRRRGFEEQGSLHPATGQDFGRRNPPPVKFPPGSNAVPASHPSRTPASETQIRRD